MTVNWNKAEFIRSAAKPADFPRDGLPQVVFAGRSNVGKSSAINRLLNRKNFARVGSAPGKTTHINYFLIDKKLYLVDLPGYGYAKVPVEQKVKWGNMIERYLQTSPMLKCVFLLIDIRHEPSTNDKVMYDWIREKGYTPVIIATKADKLNRSQMQKHVKMVREGLQIGESGIVIPFSSVTKQGREEIWELIEQMAGLKKERIDVEMDLQPL